MTNNQQNISSSDAYSRFVLGSVMTAYGTTRLMRDPKSRSGQLLVLLGSMKAAEGATRFCPRKAMNSLLEQKMMSANTSQGSLASAVAAMNSGTQSGQSASSGNAGQTGGSIMQMVGNIAQKLSGGNASQSTAGSQSASGTQTMSGGAGQNAAGSNIAQTIGNVAQQLTSGTAAQKIGNIAQTVAPQVGQMMNDVASMTESQNATGTNNGGQQASASSGASNKNTTANGNANTKNAVNQTDGTKKATANSGNTKSASESNKSGNKQATSANGNKMPKADEAKPLIDGAANKSNLPNVDASVINASSKTTDQNSPTSNILQ